MLFVDIETNDIKATKIWCVCAKDLDGNSYEWRRDVTFEGLQEVLDSYDKISFHNGIGFDIPILKNILNINIDQDKVVDTLVLSRLANPSKEGGHSLKAWGEYLGNYKGDYNNWLFLTDEMVAYCHQDVEVTIQTYKHLIKVLKGFSLKSINLEHEVQWIIQEQIRNGVLFNEEKAYILLGKLLEKQIILKDEVQQVFIPLPTPIREVQPKYKKDGSLSIVGLKALENPLKTVQGAFTLIEFKEFNLGSRQQIAQYLIRFGWKPKDFTDKGNIIIDEGVLAKVKDIKEALLIKEYMLVSKRISAINGKKKSNGTGGGWLTHINSDGRIHGNVNTCGAVTGRMTHSSPNMAQVPSISSPYGKESRELFIVSKNYKLVGCDASGLELRMLAHYMNDEKYTNTILTGDIHTANQNAAGLPTRDMAKTFIYGFLYGAGDAKIGEIVGKGAKEGKKLKETFLNNTPALKILRDKVLVASERGYLKGLDGRKLHVRSTHAALNVLLQGGGAIVMKKALALVYKYSKEENLDFKLVLNIHDEWQCEVKEEDSIRFGELSVKAIKDAGDYFNFRCPLDGEYKIGDSWYDTH